MIEEMDEREYERRLLGQRSDALSACVKAFSIFGYTENFRLLSHHLLHNTDNTESEFRPLRLLHASSHFSSYLVGRDTWLPLLHTLLISNGRLSAFSYKRRGSSFSTRQIEFELLHAVEKQEIARARDLAAELAARGEREELFELLNVLASTRSGTKFLPLSVIRSGECLAGRLENEIETLSAISAVELCRTQQTAEFAALKKMISGEGMNAERAEEFEFIPGEREKEKIQNALSCGIPELTWRVLISAFRDEVSPAYILSLEAGRVLSLFAHTDAEHMEQWLIEALSCEIERAGKGRREGIVYSVLLLGGVISSLASPEVEYSGSESDEPYEALEKGRPDELISFIDGCRGNELERQRAKLAAVALRCDPEENDETIINCESTFRMVVDERDSYIKDSLKIATIRIAKRFSDLECSESVRTEIQRAE